MAFEDLLTRRVAKILPDKNGLETLLTQKKIKLYQGFDPTGSHLHLGHTIGLRKLMEFALAGHDVTFLFGTGTVLVGDPSLRDTGRKTITQEEINENIKNWKNQVSPIVDFERVKVKQNGTWLLNLKLADLVSIASNISAVQLFKRDSFTRRIKRGDTVWYHETMYPLLQGYDSVALDVDLEIGGTDQEFNMLVGRELQHKMQGRNKFVLTTPMIEGTDGKTMSKTSGNCIFLDDEPQVMYTKLMGVKDDLIATYFELLTNVSLAKIETLSPTTPVENKKQLALEITKQFHGEARARDAAHHFESVTQAKAVDPNQSPITIKTTLFDTLKEAGLGVSNGEIKRVIEQGGVEIDGTKITDTKASISGSIIKFGKNIRRKLVEKK